MKIFHLLTGPSLWVFFWTTAAYGAEAASPLASPLPATPTASPAAEIIGTAREFGPSSIDFTWLFLKTILAMVVVIALAIIVLRFIIPKLSLHRPRGSRADIEILDRIPLGAKNALYVLRVEGRRLLISTSEHYVGLIAELDKKSEE